LPPPVALQTRVIDRGTQGETARATRAMHQCERAPVDVEGIIDEAWRADRRDTRPASAPSRGTCERSR
jgi:hypothetical protein